MTATVLTVVMGALPTLSARRMLELFDGVMVVRPARTFESIIWVAPGDHTATPSTLARGRPAPSAAVAPPGRFAPATAEPPPTRPSPPATAAAVDDRPLERRVRFLPAPRPAYSSQPVTPPAPGTFGRVSSLSAIEQDSVLADLELSVPVWPKLPPTPFQRDSMAREEARRWAVAKDQQRPVAISMTGGAALRVGVLSSGPSKEERRRDSIVHAGNMKRFEKLAERARARRDSVRFTDSIALRRQP